jgi:hypothetical protein
MGRHERMTPSAPHTGPHTASHSVSGAPQRGRLLTLLVALVAIIGLPVGNALLSPAVPVNTSLARLPLTNGLPVPKAPKISLPSVKDKIRSGNRLSTPELSRGRIYISSAQWRRKLHSRIRRIRNRGCHRPATIADNHQSESTRCQPVDIAPKLKSAGATQRGKITVG